MVTHHITTHVINVSDEENESRLIASHGGGLHFKVNHLIQRLC